MTDSLHHERTPFDSWKSIGLALYMTLVGYGVMVGIPVISTAWVELLGFTEEQVGRVAGADLGGLAAGAVLTSWLIRSWNRHLLVVLGALLAVAANGLCVVFVDYEATLWLRVLAGVGAGIYTAVAVATLGACSRPALAYNLMLFFFAFSQAAEMYFLPKLSMNGIYGVFIFFFLLGLMFIRWIPAHATDRALDVALEVEDRPGRVHIKHRQVPRIVPWLVLLAMFFTYINIGTYWTYIELATIDAGLDNAWVESVLVWVSLGSFVGCAVATLISNRFGLARPLLLALTTMGVIVGMLYFDISPGRFMVSVLSFSLLWVFVDVYQMATVANVDHSGAFASLMPGAQGLGQIVGPNIGASMLGAGLGYDAVFAMCAAAALAGMLVYLLMYLYLRRRIPALANAS
ncbi:MAG: MFS transporter [Xanthomonadales bacterium]|nr:MFS transporter [Xanthomonadales bacterium]